jgi:hypothetical protein
MNREQRQLLEELISDATFDSQLGCPAYLNIQNCHREGRELPDHLLPGRTVMRLSPEKRKLLETITAEDISKFRLDFMGIYKG